MATQRRLCNIIRRMLMGEDFYTNFTPRISKAEIKDVETKLEVLLQIEHTCGASAGPIAVYPLHQEEFDKKAKIFLKNCLKKHVT